MCSVNGPWSREQETELLHLYHFEHVEGLEDVWQFVGPGPKGAQVVSRAQALEWIKQARRMAYGGPAPPAP
jgi:hypothetical protein